MKAVQTLNIVAPTNIITMETLVEDKGNKREKKLILYRFLNNIQHAQTSDAFNVMPMVAGKVHSQCHQR